MEIIDRGDESIPEPPKPTVADVVVEAPGLYIHHAIVGAVIIAGSVLAGVVAPAIKPVTRTIIVGAGVAIGSILIWDDVSQHLENDCPMDAIWSFVPCPEKEITVVRKAEM